MASKLHINKYLQRILLVPVFLLILAATVVSCNLSGEGIFRSIARAPEISKEIKEILGMTASGIIGVVTDSADSNKYFLVHIGSRVYAYSPSDTEEISWKRITYEDADGSTVSLGGEFHLTDDTVLHYVKSPDADDDSGTAPSVSLYNFDISSSMSEFFDSGTITIDDSDEETMPADISSLKYIDTAVDTLFYLYKKTDGSFSAASVKDSTDSIDIELKSVSRFHAAKDVSSSTYYLFISGETAADNDAALMLSYSSGTFGEVQDITADFDENSSMISGCVSAAIDGVIYLTAGNFLYAYDTNEPTLNKLEENYPNDFSLSYPVYSAADTDDGIFYFSGNNILYAFSKSEEAGTEYEITKVEDDLEDIHDLYFDNDADVLYIAIEESWIWKYDPAATGEAFTQLF